MIQGRNPDSFCNSSCNVAGIRKDCVYKGVPLGIFAVLHRNFPPCFCTDERVDSFLINYFTELLACFVSEELTTWHWISPCAGFPEVAGVMLATPIGDWDKLIGFTRTLRCVNGYPGWTNWVILGAPPG